jgi:hypothetical protein
MAYSTELLQVLTKALPVLFERFSDIGDGHIDVWTPETATRYSFTDKELCFHTTQISEERPKNSLHFMVDLYGKHNFTSFVVIPLDSELSDKIIIPLENKKTPFYPKIPNITQRIESWYLEAIYRELCSRRTEIVKEEMMATAWHPKRVAGWIESGGADMLDGM